MRFLLLPGLPFALGAELSAIIHWVWKSGFSTITLTDSNFLLDVGLTFFIVYTILCFGQMIRWRKNEVEYLSSGINGKESL
jgi:hypothetical protein